MPKQTKITDSFFKPKASSSTNDNVSNSLGLLLPIDDVMDETNLLDTFINSAINGGVKRNWNIQQLKKTVLDINSEFKPQIEKRTAFWEKELEKLNNIKMPIRKSSSQSDIDSGDKSQKTLLDYFTKNDKLQDESNITTIVLESQDVPQDLVIPMLDPRTSDLNITTTNNGYNSINNTITLNNTSNNTTTSVVPTPTIPIETTSNSIINQQPNTMIDSNIISTTNNNNNTNTNNIDNIIDNSSDIFLDEEDIIKPITPSETANNNNIDSDIITLTSNDLDDLLMEDQVVPLNVSNETKTVIEPIQSSSPSLSQGISQTIPSNNLVTTNITAPSTASAGNTSSNIITTPSINQTTTTPSTATTTSATLPSNNSNATSTTTEIKLTKSPNLEGKKPKQEKETLNVETPSIAVEDNLTTPKKTRKTTSSKKSTASKKTSKKGSKKRKVQDDDAMLDDDDDEYKPSLTDEEDLILDEEIEEDDLENVGKSGKRKRPAAKKITDEEDEETLNNLLDEEDDLTPSIKTTIDSSKSASSSTSKQPSSTAIKTEKPMTPSSKSTSKTSSSTAATSKTPIKEDDDEMAEDEEEIIETPIKTRSARKKTRQSAAKTLDSDQISDSNIANKSSSKSSAAAGSTTPTSVGNNDLFEEMSNSIAQSPSALEDSNEPQTPANSKKKKRTTTTVRRRKKKEDGTGSTIDGGDGGDSFLSHEDELYVSTNSNTDTSAPSYQFWDYVNSFFPVIKKDRLQLLEIVHSDDDDAFIISKRGKHYTQKWEDENCKLFPHLFKKEPSPMENESTNSAGSGNISFSNSINVDKNSKHFFSQHNLTQRLLSSLIEERDLVSVETFFNDESSSSSTSGLVFDSDEESVDESSSRKTTRSTRKSIAGNSNNIAQYSNAFASSSMNGSNNINNNGSGGSNINSMLDNFSNSFSILEQQQQHEISEHLKQKLPTLSKTHNQKSTQALQVSNQFKDFEQQLFEPSFDYSSSYLNIFEEKLMSEIKSIGLLPPPLQTSLNTQLWTDEESREDDEICAEIRTLQNKLRQQMEKTNSFRLKILTSVKEKLPEDTDIGKKISYFSELEKKLFPPQKKR